MLKIGDLYTVLIEDGNVFANGICHIDNMAVFVEGAMAKEKCRIEITEVHTKYAFAKCVEIIEKSEHRIAPSCPYFEACGGCSFTESSLEYENQIKFNYVKSSFAKQGLKADFEKTVCPVSQNYRNKVVLFYDGKAFGYKAKGTSKIVPHNKCMLNEDMFDKIADYVARELKGTRLRALYLRKGFGDNGEIMACPIFYEKTDVSDFARRLSNEFPTVKTVLTGVTNSRDFVLEKVRLEVMLGSGYIFDTLCGLKFRISPESFYQVNHTCAEKLYEKAIDLAELNNTSLLADLFCGTGTIGIIAAHKTGATVFGVEIVEKAIDDAKFNAELNGIKNISLKAMDASKFNERVDVCIIDPPRKGCSTFMLDTLKRLSSTKIIYVSCNVDTMVRDIRSLSDFYKISSPVSIFNLFPRTSHVESLVCLTRKE